MSQCPFVLPFDRLPSTLPLFPFSTSTILPGCQLPLNIFETRYINMILDALGSERMIGLVQTVTVADDSKVPSIFHTGTAGRIVSFTEAPDNRLLIVLSGVCRFDIQEEIESVRGYRQGRVDWSRFTDDFRYSDEIPHDRKRLFGIVKEYFRRKGLETNWDILEQMPTILLINFLCSQLPFLPSERQALIETVVPEERLNRLLGFMEFEIAAAILSNHRQH